MAALGLPCWQPGVWADPCWAAGVWQSGGVALLPGATPGLLTPEQIARLRGYQAPERRAPEPEPAAPAAPDALLERVFSLSEEASGTLLPTIIPQVQAHTQALALQEVTRRQALQDDEDALALLLVLLEEL